MAVDNNKVPSWGEIQSNVIEVVDTTESGVTYTYKWFKMGRLVYVNGLINPVNLNGTAAVTIDLTSMPMPVETTAAAVYITAQAACSARIYAGSNNVKFSCQLQSLLAGSASTAIRWTCCYMTNE
jgi:hypothetical protein